MKIVNYALMCFPLHFSLHQIDFDARTKRLSKSSLNKRFEKKRVSSDRAHMVKRVSG